MRHIKWQGSEEIHSSSPSRHSILLGARYGPQNLWLSDVDVHEARRGRAQGDEYTLRLGGRRSAQCVLSFITAPAFVSSL
jgi:hypothetical protein